MQIYFTFSGGLLDFFLFGILQGNEKTSWLRVIPVGIVYFFLYYGIFRFLIRKFDFKTPGREDEDGEIKLYTRADVNDRKNAETAAAGAGDADGNAGADSSGANPENETDRKTICFNTPTLRRRSRMSTALMTVPARN